MGNIVTPCLKVAMPNEQYGLFGWTIFDMCDRWAAPHVLTPFVIALLLQYPKMPLFGKWFGSFISYVIAGFFEQFEIISRVFLGVFVTFFTADGLSAEEENFVGSYLEDWGLHGFLGSFILAGLFIHIVKVPNLFWRIKGDKMWIRYKIYYFAVIIFYILPYTVFSLDLENGFPLGQLIVVLWQVVWAFLVIVTEGWGMGVYSKKNDVWISGRWKGFTRRERLMFWWGIPLVTAPYLTQNIFDWLFSNAIQSYLMIIIYSTLMIAIRVMCGLWKSFSKISNF